MAGEFEKDLPAGFLDGYDPPVQPTNAFGLARFGITCIHHRRSLGEAMTHIRNDVRYPGALVQIHRPGWDNSEPRDALAAVMLRIGVIGWPRPPQPMQQPAYPTSHQYEQAILLVDDVGYAGLELHEYGLTARAASVDGWTVLACVPTKEPIQIQMLTVAELLARESNSTLLHEPPLEAHRDAAIRSPS